MSEAKRLHPIASIVTTAKRIRNLLFPLIAIVFSGAKDGIEDLLISLIISLILIIITLVSGILTWMRFTYRIEEDELRIEYGIFVRKKRYIPFERIQSIDLTEGLLQRLFGLVKVEIETAGGGEEAEGVLSAISRQEAQLIQKYVAAAKGRTVHEQASNTEDQLVYRITTPQLFALSFTSGGVGVVISAVFALLSQLDDVIPYKRVFGGFEKWAVHNVTIMAIAVFLGLLFAWFIALIMTLLKYANFTVIKKENDLIITHGLLERKQLTIPLNRIQALRITENLIRQLIGYGTVHLESAGGSMENQESANVVLLPIIKMKEVSRIIGVILPEYRLTNSLHSLPKQARRRFVLRMWYITVPIVMISCIFLKTWGLLSLILLGAATIWARAKYNSAGWALADDQLTVRWQFINRITVAMKKNKVQSLEMRESYFQKRVGLGTLEVFVKSGIGGGGGKVVDMDMRDIELIYSWYSRSTRATQAVNGDTHYI